MNTVRKTIDATFARRTRCTAARNGIQIAAQNFVAPTAARLGEANAFRRCDTHTHTKKKAKRETKAEKLNKTIDNSHKGKIKQKKSIYESKREMTEKKT